MGTFTTGDYSEEREQDEANQIICRISTSKQEITLEHKKSSSEISNDEEEDRGGSSLDHPALGCACNQTKFLYWTYISAGAVIGSTLRVYFARLFGEDCEMGKDHAVQDVFTPFFSRICITAGGRTIQTGGALFRDFPANLLGCFFMGILSCDLHSSPFPWFRKDHPLQGQKFLYSAFGVGVCGCLTTFASWNSQMVVMMDGTYTVLGPQIAPALFGYLLGITGCITFFRFGQLISAWIYSRVNRVSVGDCDEISQPRTSAGGENNIPQHFSSNGVRRYFRPIYLLHIMAFVIIGLFSFGSYYNNSNGDLFYTNILMASLMSPLGALVRWKMSIWNSPDHPKIHKSHWPWMPWGTLLANLTGAIVSIVSQGLLHRYGSVWNKGMGTLLYAIGVGFAGSLSTVSTFVKEVATMKETHPGHAKPFIYGTCTCVGGMIVGLIGYTLIVRL